MIQGGVDVAKGKYQRWRTPDGLQQLRDMGAAGMTDTAIAERLGIRRTTLYDWLRDYPDISDAITAGRALSDDAVEESAHRAALGYYVDEVTTVQDAAGDVVSTTTRRRWVRPDSRAMVAWLSRRRWRDARADQSDAPESGAIILPRINEDSDGVMVSSGGATSAPMRDR